MDLSTQLKKVIALIIDIIVLYAALFLTLFLRYKEINQTIIFQHLEPFSLVFFVWLIIFYILDLYDINSFKNDVEFYRKIAAAFLVCAAVAVLFFYLVPFFAVAPKTNLFIILIISASAMYVWRGTFNSVLNSIQPNIKLLIVGYNNIIQELVDYISKNPQLGYVVSFWMKEGLEDKEFNHLSQIILKNRIDVLVIPAHIKKQSRVGKLIYKNFILGIEIKDLAELYEGIFGKIPLGELQEVWFLENLKRQHTIYDFFKKIVDFFVALAAILVFLIPMLLISLIILIFEGWPIIYNQGRVGEREIIFNLYKFRSMRRDAEAAGPQWSSQGDHRVNPFGKFLRKTHLDELPQLINVLKGEIAIVGPRPERPEFVAKLREEIPFYEIRHLIKPGITGWAQTKYKYTGSIEETYEKLQYDLYYLKNRSFVVDLLIILKTMRKFFG